MCKSLVVVERSVHLFAHRSSELTEDCGWVVIPLKNLLHQNASLFLFSVFFSFLPLFVSMLVVSKHLLRSNFSTALARVRKKHKVAIVLGFYGMQYPQLLEISVIVIQVCRPMICRHLSKIVFFAACMSSERSNRPILSSHQSSIGNVVQVVIVL